MIEEPPLLRIRRNFSRAPLEVARRFVGAATGHVVDAMGGGGALDWRIKPLAGSPPAFCGIAVTCDAGPADNLALFGALAAVQPGDVIIAATGGYMAAAVTGDLLVGMARNCGAVAIVTDGAVRDAEGIVGVGLPVHCAGVSANSPARHGPGTVGLPIVIGGVAVDAGDIVVGDADGVVIVPKAIAAEIGGRLAEIRKAEAALETQVKAGLRIPDFVELILASGRIENLT
jgi:4-hydroxy-4-methyl-2-oxoglutarate aldolase